jgi:hypothetical protein
VIQRPPYVEGGGASEVPGNFYADIKTGHLYALAENESPGPYPRTTNAGAGAHFVIPANTRFARASADISVSYETECWSWSGYCSSELHVILTVADRDIRSPWFIGSQDARLSYSWASLGFPHDQGGAEVTLVVNVPVWVWDLAISLGLHRPRSNYWAAAVDIVAKAGGAGLGPWSGSAWGIADVHSISIDTW